MSRQVNSERPAYRLYKLAWVGLDWLFPPHCGGCDAPGSRWCINCQQITQIIPVTTCQRCGRVQSSMGVCLSCLTSPPTYESLRSWAFFEGPIRSAVHRLKYYGDMTLGEILARPMVSIILESGWKPDLLVPVPLGAAHQSQRGYNQAALLGRPVALANGINYSTRALHKVRETPTQVGLKYSERFQNVADAFKAESKIVAERNIVVVDDVTTSGATMEACAVALIAAGARNICGLTLARSSYQMGGNIVGNFW